MGVASKLSKLQLSDWRGDLVELGPLWSERPVVLVFLRHFG